MVPPSPADSFTPITLTTTIAATQHVGTKVPISVQVTADSGVLDTRDSNLKVEVALASECEGTFAATEQPGVGTPIMNRPLKPQPVVGKAYSATASTTWNAPTSTGVKTVCVWLVEVSDQRVFASDQSISVTVAKALPKKKTPVKKTSTPVKKKTTTTKKANV